MALKEQVDSLQALIASITQTEYAVDEEQDTAPAARERLTDAVNRLAAAVETLAENVAPVTGAADVVQRYGNPLTANYVMPNEVKQALGPRADEMVARRLSADIGNFVMGRLKAETKPDFLRNSERHSVTCFVMTPDEMMEYTKVAMEAGARQKKEEGSRGDRIRLGRGANSFLNSFFFQGCDCLACRTAREERAREGQTAAGTTSNIAQTEERWIVDDDFVRKESDRIWKRIEQDTLAGAAWRSKEQKLLVAKPPEILKPEFDPKMFGIQEFTGKKRNR